MIREAETIKRQTRAMHTAVWLRAKIRDLGLGLRPRLFEGSVNDDNAADSAYSTVVALQIKSYQIIYFRQHGP